MTIIDAKKRINDALIPLKYSRAVCWDAELENQLVNRYAQDYANGMDFTTSLAARMLGGFGIRPDDADDDEQFAIIARQIFDALNESAVKRWLTAMPREHAAAIYAELGYDEGTITYSHIEMFSRSFRDKWNECHPGDEIPVNPDFLPSF